MNEHLFIRRLSVWWAPRLLIVTTYPIVRQLQRSVWGFWTATQRNFRAVSWLWTKFEFTIKHRETSNSRNSIFLWVNRLKKGPGLVCQFPNHDDSILGCKWYFLYWSPLKTKKNKRRIVLPTYWVVSMMHLANKKQGRVFTWMVALVKWMKWATNWSIICRFLRMCSQLIISCFQIWRNGLDISTNFITWKGANNLRNVNEVDGLERWPQRKIKRYSIEKSVFSKTHRFSDPLLYFQQVQRLYAFWLTK